VTDWEPATDLEAALSDALRTGDQELYFRILARIDLLLPVSDEAASGRVPAGWGTWSTGGRTHVLAFTSVEAMRACLADHAGSARRVPYHDLAAAWPNQEWWLAINPGLPIEGYLPAWFVAQLSRGDVRLPGRTLGARARVEAAAAARARGAAAIPLSELASSTTLSAATLAAGVAARRAAAAAQAADQPTQLGRGFGPRHVEPDQPANPAAPGQPPGVNHVGPANHGAAGHSAAGHGAADHGAAGQPGLDPGPRDRATRLGMPPAAELAPPPPPPLVPAPAPPLPTIPPTTALPSRRAPAGPPSRGSASPQPGAMANPGAPPSAAPPSAPPPSAPPRSAAPAAPPVSVPTAGEPTVSVPATSVSTRSGLPTALPTRSEPSRSRPGQPEPTRSALTHSVPTHSGPSQSGSVPSQSGPTASASVRAPLARGYDSGSRAPGERSGRARVPAHAAPPDPVDDRAEPTGVPDFTPANDVEANLLVAASDGQTDTFLSTLLLARVLVPVTAGAGTALPGQPGFSWRREQVDGQLFVVVFTSPIRMTEHLGAGTESVTVKFVQLIRAWPDETWSFAVNPGTPVGATLPGTQIRALAAWAAEVGLSDEPSVEWEHVESTAAAARPAPERPVVMQKPVAPAQVPYFLERGYDRVSGFVHRASEAAHLITLDELYTALGLGYPGSAFKPTDDELYLLRWTAYRPNLYRIPYGGRDEAGMRAMQGWVIERPPFRGNGFAPSESSDVVAEFKVDSARLPHGAQMWRMSRTGGETLVALLDSDGPRWLPISSDSLDGPRLDEPLGLPRPAAPARDRQP
jgi:SseB protein N-terminal domain